MPVQTLDAPVGSRITFAEEVRAYTVRARSDRYLVCTKPFAPLRTVLYTVVDLLENVRGTENLIFGMGAETDEQCADMLRRLEGIDAPGHFYPCHHTEVSYRNRVPLKIVRVRCPKVRAA